MRDDTFHNFQCVYNARFCECVGGRGEASRYEESGRGGVVGVRGDEGRERERGGRCVLETFTGRDIHR